MGCSRALTIGAALVIASQLAGCASTPKTWQQHVETRAKSSLQDKQYFAAMIELAGLGNETSEESERLWLEALSPQAKAAIPSQALEYIQKAPAADQSFVEKAMVAIRQATQRGALSEDDSKQLMRSLAERIRTEFVAGNYVFSNEILQALPVDAMKGAHADRYATVRARVVSAQGPGGLPGPGYSMDIEMLAESAVAEGIGSPVHKDFVALLPTIRVPAAVAKTGTVQREFGELAKKGIAADDAARGIVTSAPAAARDPKSIGVIIDAQQVNASTPGTIAGAALGGAVASAAYIDKSLSGSGSSYSALTDVAVWVLGTVVGSTLDKSPQASFVTRYTVKLLDGSIDTADSTTSTPFRQTIGICVNFPAVTPTDQKLCDAPAPAKPTEVAAQNGLPAVVTESPREAERLIRCKFGSQPAVRLTLRQCAAANGREV